LGHICATQIKFLPSTHRLTAVMSLILAVNWTISQRALAGGNASETANNAANSTPQGNVANQGFDEEEAIVVSKANESEHDQAVAFTSKLPTKEPNTPGDHDDDDDEDPVFSAEVQVDINSRLVWRGIAYTSGAVVEPSASVQFHGLTAEYWSAYTFRSESPDGHLVAVTPSLSYELDWKNLYAEPGVVLYAIAPDKLRHTLEATIELGYRPGALKAFSQSMVDVESYVGAYFGYAGLKYEHKLRSDLQFDGVIEVGYADGKFNQTYLNASRAALNLASAEASLRFNLTNYLYILPHVAFSTMLMLRRQVTQPTLLTGGLAVGLEY